jgi:FkbM family methyltransferase
MFYSFEKIFNNFKITPNGVIHVGAHNGSDIPLYIKNGITHGHMFEPVHSNYLQLLEYCKNTNYKPYKTALGNTTGEVSMYIEHNNRGESCSILEPYLHLALFPHIKFTDKETVPINTLDSYNITDINFLNIDAQGYELEILKGAVNTLNNIEILYTEINRDEVYKNCAKLTELIEFLAPYGLHLVETDWYQGSCWGDGIFIKNK